MPARFIRHPAATVFGNATHAFVVGPDKSATELRERLDVLYELFRLVRVWRTLADLERGLQRSAADIAPMLDHLIEIGALCTADRVPDAPFAGAAQALPPAACGTLVIGLTGAIQSTMMMPTIRTLQNTFASQLDVILTAEACRFLSPQVLEMFAVRTWHDAFTPAHGVNVPHISLGARADVVLIMPATARTLHRIATGECSDLLSLTVAATSAPVMIAPAMNRLMSDYAPIRRNIAALRSDGMYVVEPGPGREVSTSGPGHVEFCSVGLDDGTVIPALSTLLRMKQPAATARV